MVRMNGRRRWAFGLAALLALGLSSGPPAHSGRPEPKATPHKPGAPATGPNPVAGAPGLSGAKKDWRPLTQEINKRIDTELTSLEALYKHLHAHPELAFEEEKTAARMAKELKDLGFEVTTGVGGHGVVGVLRNGKGPTVMVRTDLDALPVTEKTGLPYASKVRQRDKEGKEVGLMHACGHDMHMTCWAGTARVLAGMKDRWQGTLVFIGQPAEEVGSGARRMLADGLFKRFPRPDYALALHCDSRY